MKTTKIIFTLFIGLFSGMITLNAQEEIRFMEGSVGAILSIAQEKNKNVFIDTYADWCVPCKRMKKTFQDKDVAQFFNEHFINLRVNMQNAKAAEDLQKRYDVVFLPTMYILDPYGNVKYQVDSEISKDELLNAANRALVSNKSIIAGTAINRNDDSDITHSNADPVSSESLIVERAPSIDQGAAKVQNSSPKKSSSKATQRAQYLEQFETVDESSNKILHVLGDDEMPPEIMFQEAYFRLELMDGSHIQIARDYMSSQTNWNSDKNMKFLMDFVNSTSSKEYKFLLENRSIFEKKFGVERVKRTVDILVYKTMYNAFPRPTIDETLDLCQRSGMEDYKRIVSHYYLNRMIEDRDDSQIKRLINEYLPNQPNDHEFMYLAGRYFHQKPNYSREDTRKAIQLLSTAFRINNNVVYRDVLREVYLKDGNFKKANELMSQS